MVGKGDVRKQYGQWSKKKNVTAQSEGEWVRMGENIVVNFRDEHEQSKYVKRLHDSGCPFLYISHVSLFFGCNTNLEISDLVIVQIQLASFLWYMSYYPCIFVLNQ